MHILNCVPLIITRKEKRTIYYLCDFLKNKAFHINTFNSIYDFAHFLNKSISSRAALAASAQHLLNSQFRPEGLGVKIAERSDQQFS
jgi:hypothetical protein